MKIINLLFLSHGSSCFLPIKIDDNNCIIIFKIIILSIIMNKAVVSTGGHLIDKNCRYIDGEILQVNNVVYSCTLNQTNIGANSNKFYIMQIIKTKNNFCVFIRYGRIGEDGTSNHKDFGGQPQAVNFFEKQFRSKTGNAWSNKDNFEKKSGKYHLTVIECVDNDTSTGSESVEEASSLENELDERIVDFLKLISNEKYMNNALVQLEIDTEKMPLGKISQTQIDLAYSVLNKINKNLKKGDKLSELSSEFYTLIPLSFGRRRPPIIDTKDIVGKNVNLLNELSQMVYGTKTVTKMDKNNVTKKLLQLYQDLETEFIPLEPTDTMYRILLDYLNNSKAPTHHFGFKVLNIFEINRPKEREAYENFSTNIDNKTLLFHGTRVPNLIGILKNGLVVDPSRLGINVNITGKMFGMGLYFANSCSKSINYCDYGSSDNIACLFVSEVALGKMLKKINSDCSLTAKIVDPKGYNSTWGKGSSSFIEYDVYDDDTQIPSGKLLKRKDSKNYNLLYDEFIVYHEEQINLRYIIQLHVINDD
jgi:poly [ADP-ribose] polymerase